MDLSAMSPITAGGLPPDIVAQQLALARRQQLASLLAARATTPIEQPTNPGRLASRQSPIAALAPLLAGYTGGQMQQGIDKDTAGLGQAYQKSIMDTLANSEAIRAGSPATPDVPGSPATGPTDMSSPSASSPPIQGQPAVPGNDMQADALLMSNPVTASLGMDQIKRQMLLRQFMGAAKQMNVGGATPEGVGTVLAPGQGGTPTGFGGPAGGQPMAAWLVSDPSGKAYLEQLAKDQTPITQREGDVLQRMPDGSVRMIWNAPKQTPGVGLTRDSRGLPVSAEPIPGYAAATAGIEGAQAKAKAAATNPYEIVETTRADGRVIKQFKWQVEGYPSADAMLGEKPGITSSQPQGRGSDGTPVGALAGSKPVGVWTTVPRMTVPSGMGQSTYNKVVATKQAEQAAKLSEEYGANADAANKRLALNKQALELVDSADTGYKAAFASDVRNALIRVVPSLANTKWDPSDTVTIQKDLVNAATQKAKAQFGSRITQNEVMLMLNRGAPNVDMPKAALKYLLTSDIADSQYQIDQAQHLNQYVNQGGDPFQFKAWHAKSFPMTDAYDKAGLAPTWFGKGQVPVTPNKGYVDPKMKAMQTNPTDVTGESIPNKAIPPRPKDVPDTWSHYTDTQGRSAWVSPDRKQFREIP